MAWYLNRALTNMRAEVNTRWPGRDKASDGTIGDRAHQATNSDHNPDSDGSVDAWDMDVHGVDVEFIKRQFEAHESSGYWIHNDHIALRSSGWRRESYAYAGPNRNRHTQHIHFNTRPSHEHSAKSWGISPTAQEDDMAFDDAALAKLNALYSLAFSGGPSCGAVVDPSINDRPASNSIVNKLDSLIEATARPPVAVQVDAAQVAAALAADPGFLSAVAQAVSNEASRRLAQ